MKPAGRNRKSEENLKQKLSDDESAAFQEKETDCWSSCRRWGKNELLAWLQRNRMHIERQGDKVKALQQKKIVPREQEASKVTNLVTPKQIRKKKAVVAGMSF